MTTPLHNCIGGPSPEVLERLMQQYARIAIAGGPRTGKSTLAGRVNDRPLITTDSFRDLPWEVVPHAVIDACAREARFVVEGVQVPRSLRKGLVVDCVIWLRAPLAEVTPKQASMAKGIRTVMDDCMSTGAYDPVFHESDT